MPCSVMWDSVTLCWTLRCLDLQCGTCDVRLLETLPPATSALLGPLPIVIFVGTWCPPLLYVVGDPAADGDVSLCLPLTPLLPAVVPVLPLVLEEPGTQDLCLAVQVDDECTLDVVPCPATVVHNMPADRLVLSHCVRNTQNGMCC